MPRRTFPCAICGEMMQPGPRSAAEGIAAHARCRGYKPRSTANHGDLTMYDKHRCRCDLCREAKKLSMRDYAKRRKVSGNPIVATRKVEMVPCAHCGLLHEARLDKAAVRRFCSDLCARRFQGWDGERRNRWRPSTALRSRVLERDGFTCQLCFSPVRPDVDPTHPRYPNLDHIVPRSRGGSDDESNLRCACRQCNVRRGSDVEWVPDLAEVAS